MTLHSPAFEGFEQSHLIASAANTWTHDEVRDELKRILTSRFFVRSTRLSGFLSAAVNYLLAGKAENFKEYTVGTEVYGRSGAYDPTTDTIVRTEARRLRSKLKDYYADSKNPSRLKISLFAGSYVPVIEIMTQAKRMGEFEASQADVPAYDVGLMSVAVVSFGGTPIEPDTQELAKNLEEDLTHELARSQGIKVFRALNDKSASVEETLCQWIKSGVKFALRGYVRRSIEGPVAQLQLTTTQGMIVWSERFSCGATMRTYDEIVSAVRTAFLCSSGVEERSGMTVRYMH